MSRDKLGENQNFEDPITFRFAYESKYRDRIEGGDLSLVVILTEHELRLPYDLLQIGRQLSFSLQDLFPNLSYPVVKALDSSDLESLYQAQKQYISGELGDNATKDFVLRYVFNIAPEFINQTSDLLLIILRRHYRGQRLPATLDERLIQLLRERQLFSDWPLETIIPDQQACFAFLQAQWPQFVRRQLNKSQRAYSPTGAYIISSPTNLPFDHEDVRVYIDNLFLEGYLQPIKVDDMGVSTARLNLPEWVAVGLQIDPKADQQRRLEGLLQFGETNLPGPEVRHQEWLTFARTWAELIVLLQEVKTTANLDSLNQQQFSALQQKVDTAFLNWIKQRYGGLYNQPAALKPVMVHQIPRFIARQLEEQTIQKVALLVLDGLAFDQWLVLQAVLHVQRPQLKFRSEAVFAWLPTITSVSRQAVFAGKPPVYFPSSIHRTDREATFWKQFWAEQGLSSVEVTYAKGLGEEPMSLVEELLSDPKVRVAGLVVDKVDKIMHGMQLGTAGMHNQVHQWARAGFITKLLDQLHHHGFSVFLTSDHGNIEATGIGRPSESAIADLRGERVRVYDHQLLRATVKAKFPDAMEWSTLGLPEDYLPLLAPGRAAFIPEGESIVGHGGISVEELVRSSFLHPLIIFWYPKQSVTSLYSN